MGNSAPILPFLSPFLCHPLFLFSLVLFFSLRGLARCGGLFTEVAELVSQVGRIRSAHLSTWPVSDGQLLRYWGLHAHASLAAAAPLRACKHIGRRKSLTEEGKERMDMYHEAL